MMKTTTHHYFNRELSWLEFNQRVLNEGKDASLPLLERLKFLAISASNLDEFYMVRIGGLKLQLANHIRQRDPSGLTPRQQFNLVTRRVRLMVAEQYALYHTLVQELSISGFRIQDRLEGLSPDQRTWLTREFDEYLFPLLSPVALTKEREYVLPGLLVCCAVRLAPAKGEAKERFAVVPLGQHIPRFLSAPDPLGVVFVPAEQIIAQQIGRLFEGCEVRECTTFRITRNADIELREDASPDLLVGMQNLLDERRETACIRLEVNRSASREMIGYLAATLNVGRSDFYPIGGPLDLRALQILSQTEGFDALRNAPWSPAPSPDIDIKQSIFPQIADHDVLLIHPYESFDPVVKFVEDAAADTAVLAIKQVLYRTAPHSHIVEALILAAQAGKNVTVLVELKARFDEARNIDQAIRLEKAGVQVVYGVRGLKTHAKLCLVVRRERQGIVRYLHFGTGNYNEITAKFYSDIGYFTCRDELGADASDFFNAVTGYSQPHSLRHLDMAPFTIRTSLLKMIANEAARAKNKQKALIMMKMNALTDQLLIEALYAASRAGVKVRLNIRGICCLRPGVPGLSDNISVVSVIDRFLEHARVFYFLDGGNTRIFISSADGMPRNLDKRVELMVPVLGESARRRLQKILKYYFKDNVKAHMLLPNGLYQRCRVDDCSPRFRSQRALYTASQTASRVCEQIHPTVLQPYKRRALPRSGNPEKS